MRFDPKLYYSRQSNEPHSFWDQPNRSTKIFNISDRELIKTRGMTKTKPQYSISRQNDSDQDLMALSKSCDVDEVEEMEEKHKHTPQPDPDLQK